MKLKDVARPAAYEALVLIGEDALPNRILVHWLNSFGASFFVPPRECAVSGDTVRFEIPYREGPFRDTLVFRRMDHSWIFRRESRGGRGEWKLFAEYAVQRR